MSHRVLAIIGGGVLALGVWIWLWSRLVLGPVAAREWAGTGDSGWWKQACWISTASFWFVVAGGTVLLVCLNFLSAVLTVPIALIVGVIGGFLLTRLPPKEAYWATARSSLAAVKSRATDEQRRAFNLFQDRLTKGEKKDREAALTRILSGDTGVRTEVGAPG
jgi:hypothetical protein